MTHNQVVPGSSPGGTTETLTVTVSVFLFLINIFLFPNFIVSKS